MRRNTHATQNYKDKFKRIKKQPFSINTKTVDGSIEWVPSRTNPTDACFNVKARCFSEVYGGSEEESIVLEPDTRILAKVGFVLDLPPGWEAQMRTKMSMMLANGLSVLDSPGTIDSSYDSEVMVVLVNNGEQDISLESGDEVAQMVINKVPHVKLWHVEKIPDH